MVEELLNPSSYPAVTFLLAHFAQRIPRTTRLNSSSGLDSRPRFVVPDHLVQDLVCHKGKSSQISNYCQQMTLVAIYLLGASSLPIVGHPEHYNDILESSCLEPKTYFVKKMAWKLISLGNESVGLLTCDVRIRRRVAQID